MVSPYVITRFCREKYSNCRKQLLLAQQQMEKCDRKKQRYTGPSLQTIVAENHLEGWVPGMHIPGTCKHMYVLICILSSYIFIRQQLCLASDEFFQLMIRLMRESTEEGTFLPFFHIKTSQIILCELHFGLFSASHETFHHVSLFLPNFEVPKYFLGFFDFVSCVFFVVEHKKKTAVAGRGAVADDSDAEGQKGLSYTYFQKLLVLPEHEQIDILRCVLKNNYDMDLPNKLFMKLKQDRYHVS